MRQREIFDRAQCGALDRPHVCRPISIWSGCAMAGGFDSSCRPVPFPVVDPERIPAQRYYDEEFFKLEDERLWPCVWQMACRLEQIPNVGDYVEYTILGKSVIVVRTKDGVNAYH